MAYEFDQPGTDFQDRREYIRTLYQQELGREADQGGLDYWDQTGLTGTDLLTNIRNSAGLDNTLYQDPAYAVFMRNSRQREATLEQDRLARIRELRNQRLINSATYDRKQTQGLQQMDDSAEARGMYRSGGRIKSRADLVGDIAMDRANTDQQLTVQENELGRTAASERADISRQRDEQEVAARNRLTDRSIMEAARG